MPELLFMLKGIAAATRSVFFTMTLLIFVLYVFAIMMRQLSSEYQFGSDLFPSVWYAIGTLIIEGALVDAPGDTMNAILEESKLSAFCFGCCIFFCNLTVLNMLVGVLCEVVSAVAQTEKENLAVQFVKSKIYTIIAESGLDLNE